MSMNVGADPQCQRFNLSCANLIEIGECFPSGSPVSTEAVGGVANWTNQEVGGFFMLLAYPPRKTNRQRLGVGCAHQLR